MYDAHLSCLSTVCTATKMQGALKSPSGSESESSETECGTRDDIKVIKHLCTVGLFICNDKNV